jgi:hypothetical protein
VGGRPHLASGTWRCLLQADGALGSANGVAWGVRACRDLLDSYAGDLVGVPRGSTSSTAGTVRMLRATNVMDSMSQHQ